ncbi:MAG TPA: vWA domain-containing protein [Phenylobacterium sp.]
MFAAIGLMLIAATAFAVVDYTRVMSSKGHLQDALDAATLAAARVGGTDDELAVKTGQEYLAGHISTTELKELSARFTPDERVVRATATAEIEPYFVSMFVGGPVKISTESEVVRSIDGSLEVALVLDTTGSMAGGKIATLKTAADALVKQITKVEDADVRIAVVPFSNYVNVGVSRRSEPYVSIGADYDGATVSGSCTEVTSETVCTKSTTYACTKYNDGVPYDSTCSKCTETETRTYSPPKKSCSGDYTPKYRFRGCVGSPAYPANVKDDDPSRKYPGFYNTTCAAEIQPLTDKLGPVEATIKGLSASGQTYIPAGLQWGWNLISPATPFSDGKPYDKSNKKPRKAIVLMTDGANTLTPGAGGVHNYVGDGKKAPVADSYTAQLCTNIKAEKIEIYTVGFQIDDASAQDMLLKCASSSANYYKADSAAELLSAFEAIGRSLENLRISH